MSFLGGRNRVVAELEFGLLRFPALAPQMPQDRLALPEGYVAEEIDAGDAPDPLRPRSVPLHPVTGLGYLALNERLAGLAPRGLWFDGRGVLWILTDALLAADPATGQVRRFLSGPRPGGITGVITTAHARSLFVKVQYGLLGRPGVPHSRAAVFLVRKADGGVVGS
jgi:hypothetical protein